MIPAHERRRDRGLAGPAGAKDVAGVAEGRRHHDARPRAPTFFLLGAAENARRHARRNQSQTRGGLARFPRSPRAASYFARVMRRTVELLRHPEGR